MKRISIEELIGQEFERLTIISEDEPRIKPSGQVSRMVNCICNCGVIKTINLSNLRRGVVKSCGCLNIEKTRERFSNKGENHPSYKHGHATSNTYSSWAAMVKRCTNSKTNGYDNYGGRGITVCDRWLGEKGFQNFLTDMGKRPIGKTIDRIDNNGNYEPNNCRWATYKENNRNQNTTKLTMELAQEIRDLYSSGHSTLKELAGIYNVSVSTVWAIVNNRTWVGI